MGSVFKITRKYPNGREFDYWVIKYRLNGKSVQERLGRVGKMNKTAAALILKRREVDIDTGKYRRLNGNPTLLEYGKIFRKLKENGKPNSARMVNHCLKFIEAEYGKKRLKDITHLEIKSYVLSRLNKGVSTSAVLRELAEIRFLFNSASLDDVFQGVNPVTRFLALDRRGGAGKGKLLKISRKPVQPLTPIEFRSLIGACDFVERGDLIKDMLLLGFSLKCRTEEIRGLMWAWVKGDYVLIPETSTKEAKDKSIPLNSWAQTILKKRKAQTSDSPYVFPNPQSESGHVEYSTYRDSWEAIKRVAGINRKLDMKEVIRHTSATMSLEKGSPLPVESKYLGHSSVRTTETYYFRPDQSLIDSGNKTAEILSELIGTNPDGTPIVVDLLVDLPKKGDEKLM